MIVDDILLTCIWTNNDTMKHLFRRQKNRESRRRLIHIKHPAIRHVICVFMVPRPNSSGSNLHDRLDFRE